jgi:hypothetical protein
MHSPSGAQTSARRARLVVSEEKGNNDARMKMMKIRRRYLTQRTRRKKREKMYEQGYQDEEDEETRIRN